MPITDELKKMLTRPLGRIASGVYVLSAAHQGQRTAMLASWVQQASFEPPAITIALASGRPIEQLIRDSQRLAISVLADGDTGLMKKYARGIAPDEDAFADVNVLDTPAGLPALADSLAVLEGKVTQICDFGADHQIVIAQITWAQSLRDGQPFTHVRGSGFHY